MQVNQKTFLFNLTSDLTVVGFWPYRHSLFNVILLGVQKYDCFGNYFLGQLVTTRLVPRSTDKG